MGCLWDRRNPPLSIMVTTEENMNNAPGSSLNRNVSKTNINSSADCVYQFSFTLEVKNAFRDDDGNRFFVIKRNKGDFSKMSPFLIEKAIQCAVGCIKSIKKICSGELLIKVTNCKLATILKKCT